MTHGGRPTRSRKRYKSRAQAEASARYLNTWGKQRERYVWWVVEMPEGDFELYGAPRPRPPADRSR